MSEDILRLCRTCLAESPDLRSIFRQGKVNEEITTLSTMLTECTSVKISDDDGLPPHICDKCVTSVSRAFWFRQTCIKSDAFLREKLKSKRNSDEEPEEAEEVVGTIYFYDDPSIDDEFILPEQTEDICEINEISIKEDISDDFNTEQDEQIEEDEISGTEGISDNQETPSIEMDLTRYNIKSMDNINQQSANLIRKRRQRSRKVPGPPFKCEVCGKILSNHSSYKYHKQLHSDITPFLCSACGEGFKTRNAYYGHMTTHNKNNPHTCHVCGKSYRQAGSLRCHMHTHSGEKPFLCGICGKGMTQKSGFKKHMLTHTGEKPHQCEICLKYFRYSSNLITHKRAHSVESTSFSCKNLGMNIKDSH